LYLLYVDESGDTGLTGSQSRYFILSGFVVHELRCVRFDASGLSAGVYYYQIQAGEFLETKKMLLVK